MWMLVLAKNGWGWRFSLSLILLIIAIMLCQSDLDVITELTYLSIYLKGILPFSICYKSSVSSVLYDVCLKYIFHNITNASRREMNHRVKYLLEGLMCIQRCQVNDSCYGLNMNCPLQDHVLDAISPLQIHSELHRVFRSWGQAVRLGH